MPKSRLNLSTKLGHLQSISDWLPYEPCKRQRRLLGNVEQLSPYLVFTQRGKHRRSLNGSGSEDLFSEFSSRMTCPTGPDI